MTSPSQFHDEAEQTRQHLTQTISLRAELLVAAVGDQHILGSFVKKWSDCCDRIFEKNGSEDVEGGNDEEKNGDDGCERKIANKPHGGRDR